jgi:SUMO ligase MMS21 Smc5/6 complex component
MNIKELYNINTRISSDINQHLVTLFNLANEQTVNHIVEFGTRDGVSTSAFLAAIENTQKTLTCYDLYQSSIIENYKHFKNFTFEQKDTLKIEIQSADLLFIDTLHTYFQLFNELNLHSKQVSKFIVMHDTMTYGNEDEGFYDKNSSVKMSDKVVLDGDNKGLKSAINDFLNNTEDGKNWSIFKVYENNNGLTILKRNDS